MRWCLQAGHATSQLGQQLEELWQQVEEGRNAVIDAHQGLLDMADGAIARVSIMTRYNATGADILSVHEQSSTPLIC